MKFEWDEPKAAANLRKHKISFAEAEEVFVAPTIFEDFDHSQTEARYVAIGFSTKSRLLTVSFTRPSAGLYRIISARRVTKEERERYAQAKDQSK
ncbi:MAG: BrnT family toxin [Tepidisphaeraceae bacterium]|jgi:uncharacterized DUF497 family protein